MKTSPSNTLKAANFLQKATLATAAFLLFFQPATLRAEESKPVVKLGIARFSDAAKRDIEFQQYDWMLPIFKKENIEASLMPLEPFHDPGTSREQMDALLNQYHVVYLLTTEENIPQLTTVLEEHARMVGQALKDYVERGGGLFLIAQPVRYPGQQNEEYWNLVLEPLGARILHETVFDPTRTFEAITIYGRTPETFWYTRNFGESPILKDVHGLALPRANQDSTPGTIAMSYSDAWQVVVRGEKEAKSFLTSATNTVSTDDVGTYTTEPPIVATRTMGKGRIVSYPVSKESSGWNTGNPIWPEIVETRGAPDKGWPSDGLRLQLNAYRWLGEAATANPVLGTHKVLPSAPIRYSKSVSWDNTDFSDKISPRQGEVRGIIGARTVFSGGHGTVEEYVQAAKDAGLKFIVFSDPLEKLTKESLEALKAACEKASANGDFLAIPGIQFTDSAGIRWAIWGEKIVYPEKSFKKPDSDKEYTLWDGKRILARGHYISNCGFPPGAVLSFKELRENKSHPENLWWFWYYFPKVYEDNKLVEDQHGEFLSGLRDMRKVAVTSYTGIDSPQKVADAAKLYFTSYPDLNAAAKGLNSYFQENVYATPWWPYFYVSEGPKILEWDAINSQMEENWRYTRGAQRVRLKFIVQSDNGIDEVTVHDADTGLVRRFAGNGEHELTQEFEMVQDRARYLTLEVTDKKGQKAFSQFWHLYSYKQGLFRCGDNLNILGPLGMQWHPDRNQFFDAARNFQNGQDFEIRGLDTSIPVTPMPDARLQDTVNIRGVGAYPSSDNSPGMTSKIMDTSLSSYNMQIATMTLDNLADRFDTDARPGPSWGSSPRDLAENEYFRRTHRLVSPEDRIDWYTAWNHRRGREGRQNYQGSFNWHEGEIEFKKDVVLDGSVPIPLVQMTCPFDPQHGWGTHFIAAVSSNEIKEINVTEGKRETQEGILQAGGFVSQMPSLVGYQAFIAGPGDTQYTFYASLGGEVGKPGIIIVGLGHNGQEIKAGTVLKYRFALGAFTDTQPGSALLQHTSKTLNMAGGSDGYPLKVQTGKLVDASFFLTLKAKANETQFVIGPQKLIIDLPIVIKGIEDNGCAAVYSTKRPWFRFVSVVKDTAYFQEPMDEANDVWAGNLFVADNKDIKITAVIDGQNKNRKPFIEVHNPTRQPAETVIRSPEHAPEFGGMEAKVTIPAGTSIFFDIKKKTLVPRSEN